MGVTHAREDRAARVAVCNRFADEGGTLFGRAGQEVPEFGDRLRNLRDLAKNRIAVEFHKCENFSEKVNQFNAISGGSPTIETTINTSEREYTAPQKIEGE
jgi:hypothetical protein